MAQATSSPRRIAVYIGRFQPFHRGHEYVLRHCLTNYDETIVLIGSAHKARDIENPFTYEERRRNIFAWLEEQEGNGETRTHIRSLQDHPYNDAQWVQSVQEHVAALMGKRDWQITIVGCDRDSSTWYLKTFPQWKRDIIEPYRNIPGLSATKVRAAYFTPATVSALLNIDGSGLVPATEDFLRMFKVTPYYKQLCWQWQFLQDYHTRWGKGPFVTADACVIQSGHLLVIERGPEEYGAGLIALPGGFVKPHQRIKDAAIDELMEETGIRLAEGKRAEEITRDMLTGSIRESEQFDHPKRSLRGRIFTTAFLIRLNDTKPLPKVTGQLVPLGEEGGGVRVETADAKWIPISEALDNPDIWFEDHHAIASTMISRITD